MPHAAHAKKVRPKIGVIASIVTAVVIIANAAAAPAEMTESSIQRNRKTLVAHRGASAYAPEHTAEAYKLALQQGADFLEQDLQITKDKELICLHDLTLERTTNVEEIYPDRFRKEAPKDGAAKPNAKRWYVADFTLAEIKRLDAGSWFDAKFRGAKVPTFQEAIDIARGRAGIFPETKAPEVYADDRGRGMEELLLAALRRNGLEQPGAVARTPVIIQSFSAASLRKLSAELKTKLPLVLLIDASMRAEWTTDAGLDRAKSFAAGIGPAKAIVEADPSLVERAHERGLTVTPYTFRSSQTGKYANVGEEMRHFLEELNVDAVFTDNPDQFPRPR